MNMDKYLNLFEIFINKTLNIIININLYQTILISAINSLNYIINCISKVTLVY